MKQGKHKGERCARRKGHKSPHCSSEAYMNTLAWNSDPEQILRKARYNRENRFPNDCIDCGGPCSRQAKRCKECSNQHLAPIRRENARAMTERNRSK